MVDVSAVRRAGFGRVPLVFTLSRNLLVREFGSDLLAGF
jgi:hypothetical protein